MGSPQEEVFDFRDRIQASIRRKRPLTICELLLQGMSNIMQKYPAHHVFHFVGTNNIEPMTASMFFVLNAQIMYEQEEQEAELEKQKRQNG